ncbi:hypothetical protein [Dyadobacter sp. CY343]|uniref:hypothetical protein n=1 Tax=Dyadobacter sp. CY343 TaxID=2907299 RepID=UPI001F292C60|nr:hypothetical protein [Dyadobacter sp. CY343]MCE7061267.1 hypothetical protein [Dyadobacter sp. CY343]
MRQNNKYLEKVYEEMSIYEQHLLDGKALTTQQEDTFEKIDIVRGWLRDGFSDVDVIKLSKTDPRLQVQDRRARELLAMAYQIFADLRQLRNRDGIKYMYAEMFRKAGLLIMAKILALTKMPELEDLSSADLELRVAALQMDTSNAKEISLLAKEYTRLMKEAAVIDGAYDTSKIGGDEKKKPTKIIIKRKTIIQDGKVTSDQIDEQANYELSE